MAVTFETRDGEDWATWTTGTGDSTSDKVERLKNTADWATVFQAPYDAWKAEADKKGKAKEEPKAEVKADPKIGAEPDDNGDDDKGRRTMAKGYRK